MSQRVYLALSGVLALCGALLIIGSPSVEVDLPGYTGTAAAMTGSADSLRTFHPELFRAVGGLLLGAGSFGCVRTNRGVA